MKISSIVLGLSLIVLGSLIGISHLIPVKITALIGGAIMILGWITALHKM